MFDILFAAAIAHLAPQKRDPEWIYAPSPRILLRLAATFGLLAGLLAMLEFTVPTPPATPANDLPIFAARR